MDDAKTREMRERWGTRVEALKAELIRKLWREHSADEYARALLSAEDDVADFAASEVELATAAQAAELTRLRDALEAAEKRADAAELRESEAVVQGLSAQHVAKEANRLAVDYLAEREHYRRTRDEFVVAYMAPVPTGEDTREAWRLDSERMEKALAAAKSPPPSGERAVRVEEFDTNWPACVVASSLAAEAAIKYRDLGPNRARVTVLVEALPDGAGKAGT